MRRWIRALTAVMAVALVACGGDDAPRTQPSQAAPETEPRSGSAGEETAPAEPCRLLSADEVEGELGAPGEPEAETGKTRDGLAYAECTWSAREGGQARGALKVAVVAGTRRFEERAAQPDAEPVEGVGDGAVLFTGRASFELTDPGDLRGGVGDTERLVFVRTGGRTLIVEVNLIAVRDDAELVRRLPAERLAGIARAAVERL